MKTAQVLLGRGAQRGRSTKVGVVAVCCCTIMGGAGDETARVLLGRGFPRGRSTKVGVVAVCCCTIMGGVGDESSLGVGELWGSDGAEHQGGCSCCVLLYDNGRGGR